MQKLTFMNLHLSGGRITLAIEYEPINIAGFDYYNTKVGIAFCAPQDRFTRAQGRAISAKRLQYSNHFRFDFVIPKEKRIKEAVYRRFCEIELPYNRHYPNWTRKLI